MFRVLSKRRLQYKLNVFRIT